MLWIVSSQVLLDGQITQKQPTHTQYKIHRAMCPGAFLLLPKYMFLCLSNVCSSHRYPLEAIGDMLVISVVQIHDVMMIRLAWSPVFADWLKRGKASICKE